MSGLMEFEQPARTIPTKDVLRDLVALMATEQKSEGEFGLMGPGTWAQAACDFVGDFKTDKTEKFLGRTALWLGEPHTGFPIIIDVVMEEGVLKVRHLDGSISTCTNFRSLEI